MSGSQKRLVDGHKSADTHSFISPFSGAHLAHIWRTTSVYGIQLYTKIRPISGKKPSFTRITPLFNMYYKTSKELITRKSQVQVLSPQLYNKPFSLRKRLFL